MAFSLDHLSDGQLSLKVGIVHGASIDEAPSLVHLLSEYFELLKDIGVLLSRFIDYIISFFLNYKK